MLCAANDMNTFRVVLQLGGDQLLQLAQVFVPVNTSVQVNQVL